MGTVVHVPISRSCNNACAFCAVVDQLDGATPPGGALRGALLRARDAGASEVVLTGGEPTLSPHLVRALSFAKALGLRTSITTNGRLLADPEKVGRLVALGLDGAHVSLHGASVATHVALVGGDTIAFEQALAGLRACSQHFDTTLRTVLTCHNAHEIPALIALAAELGVSFDLRALDRVGAAADASLALPSDQALAALRLALSASRTRGVALSWSGFDGLGLRGEPAPTHPAVLDPPALDLLRAGLADRLLLGGLAAPDEAGVEALAAALCAPAQEVGHLLAARGTPLIDVPGSQGGAGGPDTPPHPSLGPAAPHPAWAALPAGARVAVVVDARTELLVARSTLPALAHALRARGVDATLRSAFRAPFDPTALEPRPQRSVFGRVAGLLRERDDRPLQPGAPGTDAAGARFLERLDLSDADVIVVGSARSAAALRRHPTRRPDARVVALDPDLLDGFDAALGPEDVLRSPWPSAARAYVLAGVPLRCVHWRPLPVHLPHLPQGDGTGPVVVAGAEGVDHALRRAWPAEAAPLQALEGDDLARLRALAAARLLWLPVRPGPHVEVAWALSVALAAGVPVVATETPLVAAHLRSDHALLVRPEPSAHAVALRSILSDDAALSALRTAAQARRHSASVEAWADELVFGAPARRVVPMQAGAGPWWSW